MTSENSALDGVSEEPRDGGGLDKLHGLWKKSEVTVTLPTMYRVGVRPPLRDYIHAITQRWNFISAYSRGNAFGQARGTFLGSAWLILDPFISSAVYFLIFGVLLNLSRGMDNFIGYLVVGTTMFGFLGKQFAGATGIISGGRNLIDSFSFPRASLVLSYTLRNILDFLPVILAMMIFITIVPPHAPPTVTWLLFPIIFGLGIFFGMGLSFLVSAATVIVPDSKFIWPVLNRFWFYGSGVFWSIDMFAGSRPTIEMVMMRNPGWQFLEISRELLLNNTIPPIEMWLEFSVWAFMTFVIGFLFYWRSEEIIGKQYVR